MSAADTHKPVVVLVRPQLGENIGKAARKTSAWETQKDLWEDS